MSVDTHWRTQKEGSHLGTCVPNTPCSCVQCDGVDLTPKIQDLKPQCIVFLNIPR